jgi:hypothetical protein
MSTPTPEQVQALADAMWQLLDDMGASGTCVCLAAKAQARVAYEPFWHAEMAEHGDIEPMDMPLERAKAILADI